MRKTTHKKPEAAKDGDDASRKGTNEDEIKLGTAGVKFQLRIQCSKSLTQINKVACNSLGEKRCRRCRALKKIEGTNMGCVRLASGVRRFWLKALA